MNEQNAPRRRRPAQLDPAEHCGDYVPEPELLEILAHLAGAVSWQQASAAQRQRVLAAVTRLRTAGLSTRTIGLASEARVAQLQGMNTGSARVARSKAGDFPPAAVTARLWDEADVEEYLRWRVQRAPYPRRFKTRFAPTSEPPGE